MSQINDLYNRIYNLVDDINKKIGATEAAISDIKASRQINIPARIERLEELLEKIDDYMLRIKGFQELAKRNLSSSNVLTIEAPPGYRVNLNRLKKWSLLIDPASDNDPYAQRVLAVAKCDECFLEKKRAEFTNRIEELKTDQDNELTDEIIKLEDHLKSLKKRRNALSESDDVVSLSKLVVEENSKYIMKNVPESFSDPESFSETTAFGCRSIPFNIGEGENNSLSSMFGGYYEPNKGALFVPLEIPAEEEFILSVKCSPAKGKIVDEAIQNYILNQIDKSPAGLRKVFLIDGMRFRSSAIGLLRKLEGSFAISQIPRNPEQLTASLEQIVSSFADMDDLLDMHDSVREYNADAEPEKRIPYSTLILIGWPTAYTERDREMIRRIMINYERYGFSCIVVTFDNGTRRNVNVDLTEYAMQNAIHVDMTSQDTTVFFEGRRELFKWYTFEGDIKESYIQSIKEKKIGATKLGNEYTERYSLVERPAYTRAYKKLELPVGIDGKDAVQFVDFENENFATYLVGASRSGKSTLLHTLIAGLIRNYHPDNVELWLADFKQLEFKRYMKHLPPHVKYVLLDESPELVYDLVDKLTEEMMERQRLFSRLGKQRIDQIDTTSLEKPLPVIFVILDEFSIMSQAIADSDIYKKRLQNLLAKGAALGIKFLFSSQTFTTGVAGLTSTARAQIQQRIAMKGTIDEISETLELSANLKTDQVRNWMEALPPHYALIKYRLGADTLPMVKRLLVLYFKDYTPRDNMIDNINAAMHPVVNYSPDDINSFVDKKPVLVDGNSYEKYDNKVLLEYFTKNRQSSDEFLLTLGVPRLMTSIKPAILSAETRENLLLVARSAENACAASIIMSAMKSFSLQGGKVSIWAYPKNPLFAEYKSAFESEGFYPVVGIDAVCTEIKRVKEAIESHQDNNRLIVMLGMDRICMDFDFIDGSASSSHSKKIDQLEKYNAAEAKDDDVIKQEYAQAWLAHRSEFRKEAKKKAASRDELKQMTLDEEKRFHEEYFKNRTRYEIDNKESNNISNALKTSESKTEPSGAYNAMEDFVYIMKQGSRNGIHFLLNLSSVADLKQTGVKAEFFRHKLLFQISADDSRQLIGNKGASTTPEHICLYDDSLSRFSFRPYIHKDIGWEGWYIDEKDKLISPFVEID